MTAPRPLYVYRLEVEYPEGIDWRNPPAAWAAEFGADEDKDGNARLFSWPSRRHYLSLSSARHRADVLRSYGCGVGIGRSEPVAWVEP